MTPRSLASLFFCASCLMGCAAYSAPERVQTRSFVLEGSDGATHDLSKIIENERFTVLVFYSESCPCLAAHAARLAQISERYREQGVAVLLVSSEVGATATRDALEVKRRGYPFLLLTDPDARLAKTVHAEFATHSVVLDAEGRIRYSGGIDSDRVRLTAGATPYLRDALSALLSGRTTPVPSREALGCVLQLR